MIPATPNASNELDRLARVPSYPSPYLMQGLLDRRLTDFQLSGAALLEGPSLPSNAQAYCELAAGTGEAGEAVATAAQ